MRTTVSIDDNLLNAARKRAQKLGVTLGQLVERALRRELGRPSGAAPKPEIPVFEGKGGLRPGIDPTSNRSLLEAMDEDLPIEKLR